MVVTCVSVFFFITLLFFYHTRKDITHHYFYQSRALTSLLLVYILVVLTHILHKCLVSTLICIFASCVVLSKYTVYMAMVTYHVFEINGFLLTESSLDNGSAGWSAEIYIVCYLQINGVSTVCPCAHNKH